SDGTVTAWGRNTDNQSNVPGSLTNVIDIAGGETFSLALKADGTVAKWGLHPSTYPDGLESVVSIAANELHAMALKADGTVVAWHYGVGQVGVPGGLNNVVSIAAGTNHFLALQADGNGGVDAASLQYAWT
ncbi:MAG: hypothetical protein K0Q63_3138, partial [Paenibacillus sp.]|nr:hypothetical protein [Paenibacillus sp.]